MNTGLRILWFVGKIALIFAAGGTYCMVAIRQIHEGFPDPALTVSMSLAMLCLIWLGISRAFDEPGERKGDMSSGRPQ